MTAIGAPGQSAVSEAAANSMIERAMAGSAIQEAMAGLATVAELPVEAHYEVLAAAHRTLRSVLDECATG